MGNDPSTCANCEKAASETVNLMQCSACGKVEYCSEDCQQSHFEQHQGSCRWQQHSTMCKQLQTAHHAASPGNAGPTLLKAVGVVPMQEPFAVGDLLLFGANGVWFSGDETVEQFAAGVVEHIEEDPDQQPCYVGCCGRSGREGPMVLVGLGAMPAGALGGACPQINGSGGVLIAQNQMHRPRIAAGPSYAVARETHDWSQAVQPNYRAIDDPEAVQRALARMSTATVNSKLDIHTGTIRRHPENMFNPEILGINMGAPQPTALHYAVVFDLWKVFQVLLASPKCDKNATNGHGRTALHDAAARPNRERYLRALLEDPLVDVNIADPKKNWTALMEAAYYGCPGQAFLLLARPDCNIRVVSSGVDSFDGEMPPLCCMKGLTAERLSTAGQAYRGYTAGRALIHIRMEADNVTDNVSRLAILRRRVGALPAPTECHGTTQLGLVAGRLDVEPVVLAEEMGAGVLLFSSALPDDVAGAVLEFLGAPCRSQCTCTCTPQSFMRYMCFVKQWDLAGTLRRLGSAVSGHGVVNFSNGGGAAVGWGDHELGVDVDGKADTHH